MGAYPSRSRETEHLCFSSEQQLSDRSTRFSFSQVLLWDARSELAASTQRRLEEAGRRKEAEEREKAEQRYVRKEYRCTRALSILVKLEPAQLCTRSLPPLLWGCRECSLSALTALAVGILAERLQIAA